MDLDMIQLLLSTRLGRYVLCALAFMGLCSLIDASIPQPGPGSLWVIPRKILSKIGGSFGWALNLIQPGSRAAAVSNADLADKLDANATHLLQIKSIIDPRR